ncbi:MAG: SDR family NAD(P)-dependent oxidoreductase [Chloroflexota bacterium]
MSHFNNKTVIVTGAGVGIGYGICEAFAKAGAYVALNDIDADLAISAADKINQAVGETKVTAYPFDIADVGAIQALVDDVVARYGQLDIAVANAGLTNFGPFLDYTPEAFDRLMNVNLRGNYFTAQSAAKAMIARNVSGRILLMASVTGIQAITNLSAYGVTKAGIRMMARVLALELGQYGITVNAIAPGATVTERTLLDDPNYEENWAEANPSNRAGYVEDIVESALFLASPGARQITGHTLVVDGGWTIYSPLPEEHPELPENSAQIR